MHRVLRPGGGYAIVWNEWDDDDPLLDAMFAAVFVAGGLGLDFLCIEAEHSAMGPETIQALVAGAGPAPTMAD